MLPFGQSIDDALQRNAVAADSNNGGANVSGILSCNSMALSTTECDDDSRSIAALLSERMQRRWRSDETCMCRFFGHNGPHIRWYECRHILVANDCSVAAIANFKGRPRRVWYLFYKAMADISIDRRIEQIKRRNEKSEQLSPCIHDGSIALSNVPRSAIKSLGDDNNNGRCRMASLFGRLIVVCITRNARKGH
jgi:hypothetical protein